MFFLMKRGIKCLFLGKNRIVSFFIHIISISISLVGKCNMKKSEPQESFLNESKMNISLLKDTNPEPWGFSLTKYGNKDKVKLFLFQVFLSWWTQKYKSGIPFQFFWNLNGCFLMDKMQVSICSTFFLGEYKI